MSRPLPDDNPFLDGNHAAWPMEGDIHDCAVEGELPKELSGTLYRNGPNPQFAPRGRYHWFDGDGMIHAFHFRDGKVDYLNRWVRTEAFHTERAAGESLLGGLTDPTGSDERAAGISPNKANTNIVWHAGRLLALWEAGPPHELDPETLETRGIWDFDGKLRRQVDPEFAKQMGVEVPEGGLPGIFTAHPKIDPETGEMLCFGYSGAPPWLVYFVIDANGRLVRSETIDVPFASMMHDFIATRDHVIFPVFPAAFDFEAAGRGEPALQWQPDRGTHIGIMPRDGRNADVTWIQSDPCYVFHPMNAHSDASRVVAEVARYPVLPLFGVEQAGPATLHRWTIDLTGGTLKEEQLDDVATEFPRLDERFAGLPYRHGYGAGRESQGDVERGLGFDSILHWDLETGRRQTHALGAGNVPGEPIFVPRDQAAPEGEGFLLSTVYRADERRSDLLVLDAKNVDAAPLATVKLPHRVPFGFHGNWRPVA